MNTHTHQHHPNSKSSHDNHALLHLLDGSCIDHPHVGKNVKTPCCRDTHSHKHRELWEPNQTCFIRFHDLSYVMILPRNFKVSGFSGAKMQMMSLCVKISSKDLGTILCFRQESVEDHEKTRRGFWWVSLFPSGKHLLPPIAIAITFRIPSRCLMPQTYSKWHIGQSQTVWWWILGECNENTMWMQCPSAISDLNISESNNVKLGLDCLIAWQSGYRFPFCPHLSKALFIHNTVSEVDGSRQRYLSLIYIYLL